MTEPSELEDLQARLRLPEPAALAPWLRKLIEHPGSCVIIAVEQPGLPEGPRVARAWLSSAERFALRKALLAVNARRAKKGQPATDEIPADGST